MDTYNVTRDTETVEMTVEDVCSRLDELNQNVSAAVCVWSALMGLLLGFVVVTEMLRIWLE